MTRQNLVEIGNVWIDTAPQRGRSYTRDTWPPRGRGRGESLTSPRRVEARLRLVEIVKMRMDHMTWQEIARMTGYKDASGTWRLYARWMIKYGYW